MTEFHTPAERFLRDMIAIPSVTGSEGLMKDYLAGSFRGIGLDVATQHVDGNRYNVIGRTGDGPIKLMFCTHMDVIPALDESLWATPPFEASYKDSRIYGRGSTDAKGQLAAMMAAMERLEGTDGIALAAVVEEETGRSVGARKLLEAYHPAACVIGEPTGLRLAVAHKGGVRAMATVHGKSAHSSNPENGLNAINVACDVIHDINVYRKSVMQHRDQFLGASSLEVTMIRGGERINVTPEKCDIYLDRRLVTGETIEGAFGGLQDIVGQVRKKNGSRIDTKLLCAYPSTSVDINEKIVRFSQQALEKSGLSPDPMGFPAGCDMWSFSAKQIPTVILGCGSLTQAHSVDEYVDVGPLNQLAEIYEALARLIS